jgi:anti-anti-sigma factor
MFSVAKQGSVSLIYVQGEIDLMDVEPLAAVIGTAADDEGHRVILSLADYRYCDSSALGVLVRAHNSHPGRFALVIPAENVTLHRLLSVTGLNKVLTLCPSVDAALAPERRPVHRAGGLPLNNRSG